MDFILDSDHIFTYIGATITGLILYGFFKKDSKRIFFSSIALTIISALYILWSTRNLKTTPESNVFKNYIIPDFIIFLCINIGIIPNILRKKVS